jgi:8-oxo-dGTP pyrophosphatase MutT (NUDIX family)
MKGRKPTEVASREAYEEAGLVGDIISKRAVGSYYYEKQLRSGPVLLQVRVFLFRVERQLDNWPEKAQRRRQWFEASEAATLVDEDGLGEIINRFSGSFARFVAFSKSKAKRRATCHNISGDESCDRSDVQ